jgi:hypothetical protein
MLFFSRFYLLKPYYANTLVVDILQNIWNRIKEVLFVFFFS